MRVASAAALLASAALMGGAPAARALVEEQVIQLPVRVGPGERDTRPGAVLIVREVSPGRHPFIVLQHGRPADPDGRKRLGLQSYPANARYFAELGFVVLIPTRTGYGVTGGPDFSGAGMFTVDGTAPKGEFFGKLVGGKLTTNNPVTTASPVKISLKLALIAGADAVELSLNGAQVQGAVSATGVMTGELHGSIKAADIQSNIVPAVAKLLTKQITDNPLSPSTGQIKSIFDTGGDNGMCTNPDNTMAKGGDGKIDICEVAQNSIIKNVLAPDIQVYDVMGNYAPTKANTKRDSLSFGVGFTAVKGGFTP